MKLLHSKNNPNPGDGMESSNLIGPIIGGVLGGLLVLLLLIVMGVVLVVSLAGRRKSDEATPNSNGTTIVIVYQLNGLSVIYYTIIQCTVIVYEFSKVLAQH